MKLSAEERAHGEHLVRLKKYRKKRRQQIIALAAECLLLCVAILAYAGVSYMAGTFRDISADNTEAPFTGTWDPDETEPQTLAPLSSAEETPARPAEESGEDPQASEGPGEPGPQEPEETEPPEPAGYTNPAPSRVSDSDGYETYVIFGVDSRKQIELLKYTMGDVCIIVAVNKKSGEVRMVSVYRDFCVETENSYFYKLTSAYAKYGAAETVAILNRNLDLQISDYVVVGWTALADLVDIMGGLEINMSLAEAEQVNNYIIETSQATGRPENTKGVAVRAGTQTLNGVSVVCYSRIRYFVGHDTERTRRQRYVIGQLLDKVKTMGVGQMLEIVNSLRSNMKTTLVPNEILTLAYNYQKYNITETRSFPADNTSSEKLDWVIFCKDLGKDVKELHRLLYNDYDYTPSANVQRIAKYHAGRLEGEVDFQD